MTGPAAYTYAGGRVSAWNWDGLKLKEAFRRVYGQAANGLLWRMEYGVGEHIGYDVIICEDDRDYQAVRLMHPPTVAVTTRAQLLKDADA